MCIYGSHAEFASVLNETSLLASVEETLGYNLLL